MRLDPPFHFALSSLNSCQRLYLECFEHNDIQKKNVFFSCIPPGDLNLISITNQHFCR